VASWSGQEIGTSMLAELLDVRHGHRRLSLHPPGLDLGLRLFSRCRPRDDGVGLPDSSLQRGCSADQVATILDLVGSEMLPDVLPMYSSETLPPYSGRIRRLHLNHPSRSQGVHVDGGWKQRVPEPALLTQENKVVQKGPLDQNHNSGPDGRLASVYSDMTPSVGRLDVIILGRHHLVMSSVDVTSSYWDVTH